MLLCGRRKEKKPIALGVSWKPKLKIHGVREYLMSKIPREMGMGSRACGAGWMERDAYFFLESSVLLSGLD